MIVRLWIKADPLGISDWINGLNLLPEIMSPRKAPLPWAKFLPELKFWQPDSYSSRNRNFTRCRGRPGSNQAEGLAHTTLMSVKRRRWRTDVENDRAA